MRGRLAVWGLGLSLLGGCADFDAAEYETVAEQIGGATLDADQSTLRYAVRTCYFGVGDPRVELELSPWIEQGEGEVEASFESDPQAPFVLGDKRSPVAPLLASFDASTACETGEVVRFTLARPGAGKTATLAWVVVARALGDEPGVANGQFEITFDPL